MANDIKKQIDSALKPTNERLDKVEQRLDEVGQELNGVKGGLSGLEQKVDSLEQKVDSLEQKVDKNTSILMRIESRLNGFADAWKINRQRLGKLQKRVIKIEKHFGWPTIREIV